MKLLAALALTAAVIGVIFAMDRYTGPSPARACVSIGSMPIAGSCP